MASLKLADKALCRPICELTDGKGHDVRDHSLPGFGRAGGHQSCE